MKKLFINLSAQSTDENIEYELLSEQEIKEIEKEHESVNDYLSSNNNWEQWIELPITQKNERILLDLAVEMHRELQPLREGAEAL